MICSPVEAVLKVGTLTFDDVGIRGCSGNAAPRGVTTWEGGQDAVWNLVGANQKGTMTLNLDGGLRSFAYTSSMQMGGKGQKVSLAGQYGRDRVELLIH